MSDKPIDDDPMPAEIDSAKAPRPPLCSRRRQDSDAGGYEKSVWEYFSGKAGQKGVNLSELLTEVLRRDIEINEALK